MLPDGVLKKEDIERIATFDLGGCTLEEIKSFYSNPCWLKHHQKMLQLQRMVDANMRDLTASPEALKLLQMQLFVIETLVYEEKRVRERYEQDMKWREEQGRIKSVDLRADQRNNRRVMNDMLTGAEGSGKDGSRPTGLGGGKRKRGNRGGGNSRARR